MLERREGRGGRDVLERGGRGQREKEKEERDVTERERETERLLHFSSQVVGITQEEVVAVQKWNGAGVLDLLTKHSL